jgi:hypothetical protein
MSANIEQLLGASAESLLTYESKRIPKEDLHLPGPDFVERVFGVSDRSPAVLANLSKLFSNGRLAGTGYVSILPVDQGIEHSAAASFAPNPKYFDPANIVELALEGGCNAVASTFGVLGVVARKYADRIPFIVKINHSELLTYPNRYDQVMFGSVEQAYDMGAAGVGATVYFGSDQGSRQLQEVSEAFAEAHRLGMFTVLWCYLRLPPVRRPHGTGEPPRRHDPGRHHQAEAPVQQRRLQRLQGLRQDAQARLRGAHVGSPDRSLPLAGRELLHGAHRPDQQRRRVQGPDRSRRSCHDRGHQQAGRRHGPDLRTEGVPASDGRGRRDPERDPGRVPGSDGDDRLTSAGRDAGMHVLNLTDSLVTGRDRSAEAGSKLQRGR